MKLALGPALKIATIFGVILVSGYFGYDYLKLRVERAGLKTQAEQAKSFAKQQTKMIESLRAENEKLDKARFEASKHEDFKAPMPESVRAWWNRVQHD